MCLTAKNLTNALYAAKQGNAEEQPDAGCGIKLWKAAAKVAAFLFTGYPRRINLGSLRAEPSSAVKL
jgi:hypothetical protein